MKKLTVTLGLAAALTAASAMAEERQHGQRAARKPSPHHEAPAPGKPQADGPKRPGPVPGQFGRERTDIEKRRGEVHRLMLEGRMEEAREKMEAVRKEMGNAGPGRPGGPRPPMAADGDRKPGGAHKPHGAAKPDGVQKSGDARKPDRAGPGPRPEEFARQREEIAKLHREGKHEEARQRIETMKRNFMARRGGHATHGQTGQTGHRPGGPGEVKRGDGGQSQGQGKAGAGHRREAGDSKRGPGPSDPEAAKSRQPGPSKPAGAPKQPGAPKQGAPAAKPAIPGVPGGSGQPDMARRMEALEKSVQSLAKQLEAIGAELKRRGSD